jgi:hypothetical protein
MTPSLQYSLTSLSLRRPYAAWPPLPQPGYLEGNMVEGPDGTLYDILRLNSKVSSPA